MPQLGAIPLFEEGTHEPGGAAFRLVSPPKKDLVLPVEGGEVEVRSGQQDVVVRLTQVKDAAAALSVGHKLAQEGLDLMSIRGMLDTVIHDAEDDHAVWWTEPDGVVLRIVSAVTFKFEVPPITATVRDKDGNEIPQTAPKPRHHIAFRFYRLAQATDDLFDAYRNMYLAFESLLSSQCPQRDGEREIDWLRRALKAASPIAQLDSLKRLPGSDPIESFLDLVYKDTRLPLFHAKEGRSFFAPQDSPSSREAVSRSLNVLTHVVLGMAEGWYGARRTGGGVFFGWVYDNARRILEGATAYASNYDGPHDPTMSDLSHPRFQSAVKLVSRLVPELQRGRAPAFLSTASGTELSKVTPLRRIEIVSKGEPIFAHVLDSPLEPDGISRFEKLSHVKATNLNQPRSLFRT